MLASEPVTRFIQELEPVSLPFLPGIALLRCRFDLADYSDNLYEQVGICCPDNIRQAVRNRKAEYLAGRYLSRILLQEKGLAPDLPSGHHRQPLWPPGWVGSITHTRDMAISCIAARSQLSLLGIDLEHWPGAQVTDEIAADIVARDEERLLLGPWPPAHALTLAFSAKESLFKAVYPTVGCYFDFNCIKLVDLDYVAKTFALRVATELSQEIPSGKVVHGHFDISDQRLFTIVAEDAKTAAR